MKNIILNLGSANIKRRRNSTSSNPTDDSRNNSKTRPANKNKVYTY